MVIACDLRFEKRVVSPLSFLVYLRGNSNTTDIPMMIRPMMRRESRGMTSTPPHPIVSTIVLRTICPRKIAATPAVTPARLMEKAIPVMMMIPNAPDMKIVTKAFWVRELPVSLLRNRMARIMSPASTPPRKLVHKPVFIGPTRFSALPLK